ncbi:MAG: MFS transporter [Smithellaceae bacterium]
MSEKEDRLSNAQGIQLCRLRDEYARPRSYMAVALASFALLAAATVPTPLYQLYREAFHFSDFTLTLIFGIYSFGVIPALLVFGPLGDTICRRRVLMVAICTAALGIAILAAARGIAWLMAGRVFVGVAIGAMQGNSSAALVEMQPRGDRRRAGVMTVMSTIGGAAAGTLVSGFMAQYLPNPFLLAYVLELGLLAIALVLVATIQEAASPVLSFVSFHRPHVPRRIAAGFMAASLSGGLIWSIAGLFAALVPSYVSNLLHMRNLAAGGALVALMLGSSVVMQLILGNLSSFRLQMFGLGCAITGMAAIVTAWHLSSLALMIAGSIVCGAAIGMTYLGSISEINRLAAPEERGSVNSLYFVIVYLFFSIPTIALGFAATYLGLYGAIFTFSGIVTVLILAEMVWLTIRQRSVTSG